MSQARTTLEIIHIYHPKQSRATPDLFLLAEHLRTVGTETFDLQPHTPKKTSTHFPFT
jgi:hypothetical protein